MDYHKCRKLNCPHLEYPGEVEEMDYMCAAWLRDHDKEWWDSDAGEVCTFQGDDGEWAADDFIENLDKCPMNRTKKYVKLDLEEVSNPIVVIEYADYSYIGIFLENGGVVVKEWIDTVEPEEFINTHKITWKKIKSSGQRKIRY